MWRTIRLQRLVTKYGPASENDWAFGQVLPLIMVLAPFLLLGTPLASLNQARRRQEEQGEQDYILESLRGKVCATQTHEANFLTNKMTVATHSSQNSQDGVAGAGIHQEPRTSESREHAELLVDMPPLHTRTSTNLGEAQYTTHIADATRHTQEEHRDSSLGANITANQGSSVSPEFQSCPRGTRLSSQENPPLQNTHNSIRENEQPINENALFLESSSAFRGAFFLTACIHVELAIYLLLGGKKGLITPLLYLTLTLGLINLSIQVVWLLYTTWTSRFSTGLTLIRSTGFVILFAVSLAFYIYVAFGTITST